jgi:hypothetical protein
MKNEKTMSTDLEKKAVKKDLLSFVMGGQLEFDDSLEDVRCNTAGSAYADSIYVKKDPPVVIIKPK